MSDEPGPQIPAAPYSLTFRELALQNVTSHSRIPLCRMNVTPTHVEATDGRVAVQMRREDQEQRLFAQSFPDLQLVWPKKETVEAVAEIGVNLALLRALADQLDEICSSWEDDEDGNPSQIVKDQIGTYVKLRFHGQEKAIEILPLHGQAQRLDWKALVMPVRII